MIYTKNINIFENIDTEEKAYWLGMIMADGSICCNQNKVGTFPSGLKIGLTDKEVMDKFKIFLGLGEDVPYYIQNQPKCQPVYYLHITCHKMAQDLGKHGAIPNKINRTKIPKLEDQFIRHFIRGYFDGDGCVSIRDTKRKSGSFRKDIAVIITSCSVEILKQVENICKKKQLIKQNRNYIRYPKTYHGKKHVPYFSISKRVNALDFLHFIYKDSSVYMERKYKLYLEFIRIFTEQKKFNRTNQYFGVRFVPRNTIRPYQSSFEYDGNKYRMGHFTTELEAAKAYNNKIIELGLSKEL